MHKGYLLLNLIRVDSLFQKECLKRLFSATVACIGTDLEVQIIVQDTCTSLNYKHRMHVLYVCSLIVKGKT